MREYNNLAARCFGLRACGNTLWSSCVTTAYLCDLVSLIRAILLLMTSLVAFSTH